MSTNGQDESASTWTISEIGNLTIQCRLETRVLVARAVGRVDGVNALQFQDALSGLADNDLSALVLDLEELSYISSAGLRAILFAARQFESKSVKLAVCSLRDSVGEVFRISGFDKIVSTYATQPEALSAFT